MTYMARELAVAPLREALEALSDRDLPFSMKRQARYIAADVDPEDAANLDALAVFYETKRREVMLCNR